VKLLFLAHRIPYPPNKGDKIRSFHWLRALVERGHQVHVLAFADDRDDLRYESVLADLCSSATIVPLDRQQARLRALASLLRPAPLSFSYFACRQMQREVEQLAPHDFDVVFASGSTMAQYVRPQLAPRTVVDMVDVDSEKWQQYAHHLGPPRSWLYQIESRRLRRYERSIVARFAATIVTDQREAALLDGRDRLPTLYAITNGVDLERFHPHYFASFTSDNLPVHERKFLYDRLAPRLVFVGAMDYYPNADGMCYFVEQAFPSIREREPRTELLIVGPNPSSAVRRLAACPGVTVTGRVQDVRPYLAAATACIVPLRIARGVPLKLLEAMAVGRAVVATPQAVAGTRVRDGEHVLVARTVPELVNATLRLIKDQALRSELGARARRFVEREHDWAPLKGRMVELVESAVPASDSRARPTLRTS
jgi:sugar transferase (PEP-CTERM/EpsH1 system associated)